MKALIFSIFTLIATASYAVPEDFRGALVPTLCGKNLLEGAFAVKKVCVGNPQGQPTDSYISYEYDNDREPEVFVVRSFSVNEAKGVLEFKAAKALTKRTEQGFLKIRAWEKKANHIFELNVESGHFKGPRTKSYLKVVTNPQAL